MMRAAIALVSLVAAPAAVVAGVWQGQTTKVEAPVAALRINAPLIAKPGSGAADAGRYFAALNAPPPPPPPPPSAKPPPPPPPPDVAVLFRRDLSAVLTSPGAAPKVVLTGQRSLRPGEIYRDGWTLASLTSTTATLTKGKEQRSIGLFTPPPPSAGETVVATAPALVFGSQTSLTNGVTVARPNAAQIASVMNSLRASGMNQQQLDRMSRMLETGQMDMSAVSQMLGQLGGRGGGGGGGGRNGGGGNRGGGGGGGGRPPNAGFGGSTFGGGGLALPAQGSTVTQIPLTAQPGPVFKVVPPPLPPASPSAPQATMILR